MNGAAPLIVGDPLPDIRLVNQASDSVSFYHQSIAGDPVVLFLCPTRVDDVVRGPAASLIAQAEAFAALPARIFIVSPAGIESHRMIARGLPANVQLLSDPVRKLLTIFGESTTPRLAVLRPNMRLAAILAGPDAIGEALALCRSFINHNAPVITVQAPVLMIEHIFTADFCAGLVGLWKRGNKNEDRLTKDDPDARESMKRRADVAVEDGIANRDIKTYLSSRVLPELAKAFRFQVTELERYRIGCYDATRGDQFRHRDLGTAQTRLRAFALSLNLNDDYEGGEIMFPEYGHSRYRPGVGAGIVYSSTLLHEALPVTKGQRFALLTFFSGRGIATD